jgi:hypothetical protein
MTAGTPRPDFRPVLEALEGRECPSTMGMHSMPMMNMTPMMTMMAAMTMMTMNPGDLDDNVIDADDLPPVMTHPPTVTPSTTATPAATSPTTPQSVAAAALQQLSAAIGTLNADLAGGKVATVILQDVQNVQGLTGTAIQDLAATPPSARFGLDQTALGLGITEEVAGFAVFGRGITTGSGSLASAGAGLAGSGMNFAVTAVDFLFMDLGARGI